MEIYTPAIFDYQKDITVTKIYVFGLMYYPFGLDAGNEKKRRLFIFNVDFYHTSI